MISQSGVIYDSHWLSKRGVLSWLVRTLGYGFIVASFAGVIFNFLPVISSELNHRFTQKQKGLSGFGFLLAQAEFEGEVNKEKEYAKNLAQKFGLTETDFSLYIPKIGARAKILENVDPAKKENFQEALKKGVAHAAGSSFPGMEGGTYLFAHSTDSPLNLTRYNAVFYLLRELEPGDEIYIFFLDRVYKYKVAEKQIIEGNDLSWLTGAKSGSQRLILQTCWPPGTTWKRLIIVAYPIAT